MTPSDQTKLLALKAALRRVIETKATDAPWTAKNGQNGVAVYMPPPFQFTPVAVMRWTDGLNEKVEAQVEIDCAFIALSRQLLPATAQGLLLAITGLEETLNSINPISKHRAEIILHSILTAFPDEIL